jgi:hypothetical protein
MTYTAKVAVCSEIAKIPQRKASTFVEFLILTGGKSRNR